MASRLFAFVLVFLLLGMQQEVQVHALTHAGLALKHADDVSFHVPAVDAPCALCGLLASGSNAVAAADPALPTAVADSVAPDGTTQGFASSPPHYYRSRAPPTLL